MSKDNDQVNQVATVAAAVETSAQIERESKPPSYESVNFMNRLKNAKQDSKSPAHFAGTACAIICGSVVMTVLMIVSLAIPIVRNYFFVK